ncbi:conserved hypothetical protein [Thiocapsa sp. KS1]|jgi:hypothetical protein|nr:conserved hypothetical protein [Thiocapsa sp. KS1]
MAKRKRKLTATETAAKKRRREESMVVLIKGKQKRVPCPPTIDGLPVDEFLLRNAEPLWLHQNEMWESIDEATARTVYGVTISRRRAGRARGGP